MNKTFLLGRLVSDPKFMSTASGKAKVVFTVACQRPFKNQDGKYDADFIDCTAWRERAEFVSKWFRKGSRIALEGRIETYNYEKDGERRYGYTVNVDNVEFAESQTEAKQSSPAAATAERPARSAEVSPFDDDLDSTFEPLPDSELPF